MLEAKKSLWFGIFAIYICCIFLYKGAIWMFSDTPVTTVTYDVKSKTDNYINEYLSGLSIGDNANYSLSYNAYSYEVAFREHSDTVLEGYDKDENFLTSPIVLYVNKTVSNYPDGFIKVDDVYNMNLKEVLEGIYNGKTWKEFGASSHVAEGDMTLYVYSGNTEVLNRIKDLFRYTLNNNIVINEGENAELDKKVNDIISKCVLVDDVSSHLGTNKKTSIYIGPEYLYLREIDNRKFNGYYFIPVYPIKTLSFNLDLYIKSDNLYNANIYNSLVSNKVVNVLGYRVKGHKFNYSNMLSVVNYIDE